MKKCILSVVCVSLAFAAVAQETWRGLIVTNENRCTPYESDDYPYSQSVEQRLVTQMGNRIYGPYSGSYFQSTRDTDIEHIVAKSEAHDSGLCSASKSMKATFASDILNLTLASPSVNRHQKSGKDAAEWMPDRNKCWFAHRVVAVKTKYKLSVDRREMQALENVLSGCDSTEMVFFANTGAVSSSTAVSSKNDSMPASLQKIDTNGNGRITCAEARAAGITPVHRSHPAYAYMRDGDGDGWVCE